MCLALLVLIHPPALASEVAPARIIAVMEKAADWQLRQLDADKPPLLKDPNGWNRAVFWLGLAELAGRRPETGYRDRIMALGAHYQWRLGYRPDHADDHLIGQTWLWAAAHGAGPESLSGMKAGLAGLAERKAIPFNASSARFPTCAIRLCWSDALFMSPPTLIGLSRATGDPRYADLALAEVAQSVALLYDPDQHLFHRDDRFIAAGNEMFWSRGNAWALAGLANMLRAMEAGDSRAAPYRTLFRDMADRVKDLQHPDGAWSASLLDRRGPPETSGTGLFVFALAWGVNSGLLDARRFTPVVLRGWSALNRAVRPDGAPAWVQPIGDRPAPAGADDAQPLGTGAFLLAGTQLLDMAMTGISVAVAAPPR